MNRYIYVYNNPVMGIDPSGYYSSGVPTNVQKILNLREQKKAVQKKSEYYKNKYTPKVTVSKYLDDNIVIVPDALVPGKAGYWNGAFCSDGGAKAQQYLGEGAPDFVKQLIMDANFVAMSEEEVIKRKSQLETALTYTEPFSVILEQPLIVWGKSNEKHVYIPAGEEIIELQYGQRDRGNMAYVEQAFERGDAYMIFVRSGRVMPYVAADCSSTVSDILGQVKYYEENGVVKRNGNNLSVDDMHYAVARDLDIGDYANKKKERELNIKLQQVGDYNLNNYSDNSKLTEKMEQELQTSYKMIAPGDAIIQIYGGDHTKAVLANDSTTGKITTLEMTTKGIVVKTVDYSDLIEEQYLPITSN